MAMVVVAGAVRKNFLSRQVARAGGLPYTSLSTSWRLYFSRNGAYACTKVESSNSSTALRTGRWKHTSTLPSCAVVGRAVGVEVGCLAPPFPPPPVVPPPKGVAVGWAVVVPPPPVGALGCVVGVTEEDGEAVGVAEPFVGCDVGRKLGVGVGLDVGLADGRAVGCVVGKLWHVATTRRFFGVPA